MPEPLDFASIDVSFISLKLIFPALYPLLRQGGQIACLIKPQFEAGREKVGKKGVVRDPAVHLEVLEQLSGACKGKSTLQYLELHILPSAARRGTLNIWAICAKREEPDAGHVT